jgi:hypothetical protein
MESESIAALLGGIYVALCAGLSDEGIAAANDILFYLAGRPTVGPEEARIFRLIAESATINESERRPTLRVIEGGASRSGVGWNPAA